MRGFCQPASFFRLYPFDAVSREFLTRCADACPDTFIAMAVASMSKRRRIHDDSIATYNARCRESHSRAVQ